MDILDVMNSLYSAEGYWWWEVCIGVCVLGRDGGCKVNNRYQVSFTIIKQQNFFDRQFHYGCMDM